MNQIIFPPGFNPKPTLTGDGLTLRPLNEGDVEGLYEAASDPKIWANHPATDPVSYTHLTLPTKA